MSFFSTELSLRITDNVAPVPGVVKSPISSTVIAVVVALFIRPPLLSPLLTGSNIEITEPGLTDTPASIEAEKVTSSFSTFYS